MLVCMLDVWNCEWNVENCVGCVEYYNEIMMVLWGMTWCEDEMKWSECLLIVMSWYENELNGLFAWLRFGTPKIEMECVLRWSLKKDD